MRVVFMGTPEFAVPCLRVVAAEHQLLAIVTQPDSKQGRGQKIRFSPIKEESVKMGIPIYQPVNVKDKEFFASLRELAPEIIVVVAFGQKIPKKILDLPPEGCINVHSSLLPKYRGAAPIQYAIIDGDEETGVTTMYLSKEWDAGDIILQDVEPIFPTDTAGTLHDRLARRGADLLSKTIKQIEAGCAPRVVQNHNAATYAYKLTKDQGEIHWEQPAERLVDFIRGMNPWPGAYTYYQGVLVKVWAVKVVNDPNDQYVSSSVQPGEILAITNQGIMVSTARGVLALKELQRQGSKRLSALDFANGIHLQVGHVFKNKVKS